MDSVMTTKPTMKSAIVAAIGLLALAGLPSAVAAANPQGTWLSQKGDLKERIGNCSGNRLCGTVVWLDEPTDPKTGRAKTDKKNPDPAKQTRPLLGLQVASGLAPSGPNKWSGSIYNADDGRTYQVSLTQPDADTLRMQGCVLGILCKTHTWTRS